jgi:flagellar motility protein MotE (MotC chaperone)
MSGPDDNRDLMAYRPKTYAKRCCLFLCFLSFALCLLASVVPAQEDILKLIETKQIELMERERALTRDEQRMNIIRKQVDEKIEAYSKLLLRVDAAIKILEQAKGEKIDSVVKAYEVMSPEDAAVRLSSLDDNTILQIMTRMKSKKAGAIMGLMEPKKAAALTKNMTALPIKHEN